MSYSWTVLSGSALVIWKAFINVLTVGIMAYPGWGHIKSSLARAPESESPFITALVSLRDSWLCHFIENSHIGAHGT